uniref:Uncharacterized protein n=1 Tax=Glossina palpalis gambiensis TaxID=67801 RepID=A0A1B0BKR3_9MUSC
MKIHSLNKLHCAHRRPEYGYVSIEAYFPLVSPICSIVWALWWFQRIRGGRGEKPLIIHSPLGKKNYFYSIPSVHVSCPLLYKGFRVALQTQLRSNKDWNLRSKQIIVFLLAVALAFHMYLAISNITACSENKGNFNFKSACAWNRICATD